MKRMHSSMLVALSLTATVTVGVQRPAQAFSIYFGEDLSSDEWVRLNSTPNADSAHNQFLSRLVGVGTETFESYPAWQPSPLSISFGSAGTATLGGDGYIVDDPNSFSGRYPASGRKYWEAWNQFSISFSNPIAAFGFYGVDIGDIFGNLTLTLLNSQTGSSQILPVNHSTRPVNIGGSVLYFGLIADSPNEVFDRIIFGNTSGGNDAFAFDNMTIGSLEQVIPEEPVPEPATVAGMLLGGGLLVKWRRQRQQKAKR